MATKTKNFTDINQDNFDALTAALDKFGMNSTEAVVREHYEFLVSKGRFESIKHPNHLKNAMEKYAKHYREASNTVSAGGGSRADARELAYENATAPDDISNIDDYESEQAPQDPPDNPKRRGNGSTPKPKPATTEAPPAEQTPQDAPPEHEPERAPMSPEVAEAAGELTGIVWELEFNIHRNGRDTILRSQNIPSFKAAMQVQAMVVQNTEVAHWTLRNDNGFSQSSTDNKTDSDDQYSSTIIAIERVTSSNGNPGYILYRDDNGKHMTVGRLYTPSLIDELATVASRDINQLQDGDKVGVEAFKAFYVKSDKTNSYGKPYNDFTGFSK